MKSRFLIFLASCLLWAGVAVAKVNINTASLEELDTLAGIGEARAAAIIKYREEHGPFKSINDLKNIPNFPDSLVGKLKGKVSLSGLSKTSSSTAASRSQKVVVSTPQSRNAPMSDLNHAVKPAAPARPATPSESLTVGKPASVSSAEKSAAPAPARPAMPGKFATEAKPAAPAAPLAKPALPAPAMPMAKPASPAPAKPLAKPAAPVSPEAKPAAPARPAVPARPAQPAAAN